jgi:hypothetical protein
VENGTGPNPRVLPVVMAQEDTGFSHKLRDFVTTVSRVAGRSRPDLSPLSRPTTSSQAVWAQTPDEDWNLDQVLVPSHFCPGGTAADMQRGNQLRAALLAHCGH